MAKNVDILIAVNTGTVALPTWTVVAGQRSAKFEEKSDTIDLTTKDSGGAKEFDYGLYEWTVSCDGLYIKNETAMGALKTAMRTKAQVQVQMKEDGTATEVGYAIVKTRSLESPYDGESKYSVDFQGTGKLTPAS